MSTKKSTASPIGYKIFPDSKRVRERLFDEANALQLRLVAVYHKSCSKGLAPSRLNRLLDKHYLRLLRRHESLIRSSFNQWRRNGCYD